MALPTKTRIFYCPVCGRIKTEDENQPGGLTPHQYCPFCEHEMILAPKRWTEFQFADLPDGRCKRIDNHDDYKKKNISYCHDIEGLIRNEYFFCEENTLRDDEVYNNRLRDQYQKQGLREYRIPFTTPLEVYEHRIAEEERKKNLNPTVHAEVKPRTGGEVVCPRCGSTSISTQQKFSTGKAVAGGLLAGVAGALIGGKGSNEVLNVCQNCGHKWKPGSR